MRVTVIDDPIQDQFFGSHVGKSDVLQERTVIGSVTRESLVSLLIGFHSVKRLLDETKIASALGESFFESEFGVGTERVEAFEELDGLVDSSDAFHGAHDEIGGGVTVFVTVVVLPALLESTDDGSGLISSRENFCKN